MSTSVGNPWLRHSSHPQEKEGGPKKNEKKKKHTSLHSLTRVPPAGPPTPATPPPVPPPFGCKPSAIQIKNLSCLPPSNKGKQLETAI
jgi:hypothetical protein